jgi:hypothetical protein
MFFNSLQRKAPIDSDAVTELLATKGAIFDVGIFGSKYPWYIET